MVKNEASNNGFSPLPAGVFILNDAKRISINSSDTFSGVVVHADNRAVYQKIGDSTVRHTGLLFKKLPAPGDVLTISYANGRVSIQEDRKQKLALTKQKKLSRH